MKSRSRITKIHLEADSKEDYMLVGIVSAEPDYRLSLALNRNLGTSLKNSKPIELETGTGADLHFSRFTDLSKSPESSVSLVSNKSGRSYLLRKLDRIDYFLLLHSDGQEYDHEKITAQLRSIDTVTGIFILQPGNIKDKNIQYLIP